MALIVRFDVLVIGGGFVGSALARALRLSGFSVGVVEKAFSFVPDDRVFALAVDTMHWLEKDLALGPFDKGHIEKIVVSYEGSARNFSFDTSDTKSDALGYMVESASLLEALGQERTESTFFCPDTILSLTPYTHHIEAVLASGVVIEASLLIAADGRHSAIRQKVCAPTITHTFPQKALIFTVKHTVEHTTAFEHFFEGGSVAVLPMTAQRSAIVWMDTKECIDVLAQKDDRDLFASLEAHIGQDLGCEQIVSGRSVFPLETLYAWKTLFPRTVLMGDAAHVLHPIIGQGVNLGFRESIALVKGLAQYKSLGLDWGSSTCLSACIEKLSPLLLGGVTTGLVYGLSMCGSKTLWNTMVLAMTWGRLRRWIARRASFGSS